MPFNLSIRSRKKKLLLFEHEPQQLKKWKQAIAAIGGYQLYVAQNSEEALSSLKSKKPDVMLIRLLADQDTVGVSFIQQAKAQQLSLPPFIYLTDALPTSLLKTANTTFPFAYLTHCFEIEELRGVLSKLFPAKGSRRESSETDMPSKAGDDHLIVKKNNSLVRLAFEDIHCVEVKGKYSLLTATKGSFLVQKSLKELERILPSASFVRVHRNYIVNLYFIDKILLEEDGILLKAGQKIPYSQRMKKEFLQKFDRF